MLMCHMTRKFTRHIEDFTCAHCGAAVTGDGYTNHCPKCLYSRHVDVNPGDRAHECGGLMEPVGIEQKKGVYVIVHRCAKCGFTGRNRTHTDDDPAALRDLSRKIAERTAR